MKIAIYLDQGDRRILTDEAAAAVLNACMPRIEDIIAGPFDRACRKEAAVRAAFVGRECDNEYEPNAGPCRYTHSEGHATPWHPDMACRPTHGLQKPSYVGRANLVVA